MSPLQLHHMAILEKLLVNNFIAHLPPLIDTKKSVEQQLRKNLSRGFSAFALHKICNVSITEAANSVIDDFDDYGVDAIYYHALSETIYLVQSKLKAAEEFSQEEALAFCQGVRKLINQDFTGFNANVQKRLVEIEDALDNCNHIQLVVAHTGSGISKHAKKAVEDLLSDDSHGEERLVLAVLDYDCNRVVDDLRAAKAYSRVDTDIWVQKCTSVKEPRVTYFGLANLEDLVKLHQIHEKGLYEKNIRNFLGQKTDVNTSILQTLATNPQDFLYLNNGVTALCQHIEPKSVKQAQGGRKRLKIKGFSIINGAQTIATSAKFVSDSAGNDVSLAKVFLTLIKTDVAEDFGKMVTRARNHQNPVNLSNFVALDDDQERIRRELAYLDIHYVYKAEGSDSSLNLNTIRVEEAAHGLALFQADPRFAVWLKKEPSRLLDTNNDIYKMLFNSALTAQQVVNAVRFYRYIQQRMSIEAIGASGQERLAYKHGNFALGWVLAKRVENAFRGHAIFDAAKLGTELSVPFDSLRQVHWEALKAATFTTSGSYSYYTKGPLAFFRNQADAIHYFQEVLVEHYNLQADPVVGHKKGSQKMGEPYPIDLFKYLVSKAPQIGNLS